MFYDIWNCGRLLYSLYCIFYHETDDNIERLKVSIHHCGAIGHKLLQFLLMHDGFMSKNCKQHFQHVFENCENHSWEYTESCYKNEFHHEIEDDFIITESSKVPIGSGSIGQVYKLYDKERGGYVALKIKHPNIDSEASRFVRNVSYILRLAEYIKTIPFSLLIYEFLNNVHIQLDYSIEARNTQRLQENFSGEKHICIPTVFESSENMIVMSYHEGIPYHEIKDARLRYKVAFDMYFFMMTSTIIHDFIHCDLHYGNWKVNISDDYQLVIYDCGIVASTGNQINKDVIIPLFDGNYTKMINVLIPDIATQKHGKELQQYLAYIEEQPYETPQERFTDFLRKALTLGIRVNTDCLRCVQGLITCMSYVAHAVNKVSKIIGKGEGDCQEVMLCFNYEMLKRLGTYPQLLRYIEKWKHEDTQAETCFLNWLEEEFGHRDVEVLMDVVMKQLRYVRA